MLQTASSVNYWIKITEKSSALVKREAHTNKIILHIQLAQDLYQKAEHRIRISSEKCDVIVQTRLKNNLKLLSVTNFISWTLWSLCGLHARVRHHILSKRIGLVWSPALHWALQFTECVHVAQAWWIGLPLYLGELYNDVNLLSKTTWLLLLFNGALWSYWDLHLTKPHIHTQPNMILLNLWLFNFTVVISSGCVYALIQGQLYEEVCYCVYYTIQVMFK